MKPVHSRVSSYQSLATAPGRSSTPKVPPGFENSHSHPSPSLSLDTSTSSIEPSITTKVTPIVPVVPTLPLKDRVAPAKANQLQSDLTSKGVDKTDVVAAPSTHPEEEVPGPSRTVPKVPLLNREQPSTRVDDQKTQEKNSTSSPKTTTLSSKISKEPEKIEPQPATPARAQAADVVTPLSVKTDVATPATASSRPATPTTTSSQISKAPAKRPLTIRVTTNKTQPTESVPLSAATERSITLPSASQAKAFSRIDSLASPLQSRPSTPSASQFSGDISRASSPPPSIVGSAPERTKTKAQQKKERKDRAKEKEEPQVATPPPPPVAEVVAPVVGRQRKQKKPKVEVLKPRPTVQKDKKVNNASAGETTAVKVDDKKEQAPIAAEKVEASVETSPEVEQAPEENHKPATAQSKSPFTLGDLFAEVRQRMNDNPNLTESKVLLQAANQALKPLSQLLGDLIDSGDLDAKKSAFLNPQPLAANTYKIPIDSRKGQDYLSANGYVDSNPFGYIYLGNTEKTALIRGQDVSVSDENRPDDILRRSLVTGWGTVYRHLTSDEEEQAVTLEERREEWLSDWGKDRMGLGLMNRLERLEPADYNNIDGDVADLVKEGDKFGISWLKPSKPGKKIGADEDDDDDDDAAADEDVETQRQGMPFNQVTEYFAHMGNRDDDLDDSTAAANGQDNDEDEDDENDSASTTSVQRTALEAITAQQLQDAWTDPATAAINATTSKPILGPDHIHLRHTKFDSAAPASLRAPAANSGNVANTVIATATSAVTQQTATQNPATTALPPMTDQQQARFRQEAASLPGSKFNPHLNTRLLDQSQLRAREEECWKEIMEAKRELERVERLVKGNQRDVGKFLGRVGINV